MIWIKVILSIVSIYACGYTIYSIFSGDFNLLNFLNGITLGIACSTLIKLPKKSKKKPDIKNYTDIYFKKLQQHVSEKNIASLIEIRNCTTEELIEHAEKGYWN